MAADVLRITTCGNVDDGKSSLIGRMLYDLDQVPQDQLAALTRDSKRYGAAGAGLDLSLLVDGLQSEREQGITIDVAYRYFATPRRKFIVADTPGHQQYTRNMATGASVSDVAVILVDARGGIVAQTRRHIVIAHLLGIRCVVLAVNKMDLASFDRARFDAIASAFASLTRTLGITDAVAIPLSAMTGANVVHRDASMPWFDGPTLVAHLETLEPPRASPDQPMRLPVQTVIRNTDGFRGYAGTLAAGTLATGDAVLALPSGRNAIVTQILAAGQPVLSASSGHAIAIALDEEIDVGRGDLFSAPTDRPEISDQISAHVIWFSAEPMIPGRRYLAKCGTQSRTATITRLRHRIDVETLGEQAGRQLEMNDIGVCNLSFNQPIVFEPYARNRTLGSFILIDQVTRETLGAGLIQFGLRRATNVHWQHLVVDREGRAAALHQRPRCVWFTGLSGSGKSTLANRLEQRLHASGRFTYILDGDNVRHGLNRDLGFTDADRVENVRRVAEVARLFVDAGLIVLVSFISPFRAERQMARDLFAAGDFIEAFVDTPLAVCEQRDPKGLYAKARAGQLANFTGIDSPYEPPEAPELRLDAANRSPEELVEEIVALLESSPRRDNTQHKKPPAPEGTGG